MSRVIKSNDGVAVVEGTPAASLVKDVDKFFASKPPERMAGESIGQPRKLDPRAINKKIPISRDNRLVMREIPIQSKPQSERTDEERRANLEAFDRLSEERKREMTINTRRPTPKDLEQMNNPPVEESAIRSGRKREVDELVKQQAEEEAEGRVRRKKRANTSERHGRPVGGNPNRNKAKDKAESRRRRFFERRRSKKEAVRSQREQEATQGKFITTLRR